MTTQYIGWPTGQKEVVLTRIAKHRVLDQIVQGNGWDPDEGTGCAVGCSLDEYSHDEYVRILGVDLRVARIVDGLQERQTREKSLDWPGRVANAIKSGADTTLVADRFLHWLMTVELVPLKNEQCEVVGELYRRRIAVDEPRYEEWDRAASAARAASDARPAWAARAASAAWAAWAASAAWAAWAVGDAWAASAARAASTASDARAAWAARAASDASAVWAASAASDASAVWAASAARFASIDRQCDALEKFLRESK